MLIKALVVLVPGTTIITYSIIAVAALVPFSSFSFVFSNDFAIFSKFCSIWFWNPCQPVFSSKCTGFTFDFNSASSS